MGKTVGEWCREVLLSTDAEELATAAEQAVRKRCWCFARSC